jgi:hypothetical protein
MITINETHLKAIKSVATMVETKLEEMENCLLRSSLNARALGLHHNNDMTQEEIKLLQHDIDVLYGFLIGFFAYKIPKEEQSLKREIIVKTGFLWEELSDLPGRKFYGYSEEEWKIIQQGYYQQINAMIEAANNIYRNIKENNQHENRKSLCKRGIGFTRQPDR